MTRHVTYSTGASFLIVGPAVAALTGDAELGQRIWPLIEQGATGHAVLDEASRDGLTRMPDLLLVEFDGSRTRVFVRGPHSVDVRTANGSLVSCSGEQASTWSEQVFDEACSGAVNTANGVRLPVVAGMVPAGGFDWAFAPVDMSSEPSKVSPEVETPSAAMLQPPAEHSVNGGQIVGGPTAQQIVEEPIAPAAIPVLDVAAPLGGNEPIQAPLSRMGIIETRTEPADEGFDHLFGSTIDRSVEDAAVREAVEAGQPPATSASLPGDTIGPIGDHDGETILVSTLPALRPMPQDQAAPGGLARAQPAVLELSTGDRVPLDRGVVIGRRPQIDRVAGDAIPRMITVESPLQDISRSHIQISSAGDNYTVTDLHSMNGSVVIGADGTSRILSGGDTVVLHINDVIDIGEDITFTVRPAR